MVATSCFTPYGMSGCPLKLLQLRIETALSGSELLFSVRSYVAHCYTPRTELSATTARHVRLEFGHRIRFPGYRRFPPAAGWQSKSFLLYRHFQGYKTTRALMLKCSWHAIMPHWQALGLPLLVAGQYLPAGVAKTKQIVGTDASRSHVCCYL